MWTNQTIFSVGDLSGTMEKEYHEFIEKEYNGSYSDRLMHIEHMLERLEFEKKKIIDGNFCFDSE